MREEIKKELKNNLTSDEMHIIQRLVCQTNEEMQKVMDLYTWDEKKRVYVAFNNKLS